MQNIEQVTGSGIPLLLDDIDTDRIIPARFLRCVTFEGLGENAFEDDRKQDKNHPFDNSKYSSASVLVAGRNFGCGSSREHAPQSLMRWGIKTIIAESFAEIFFGNCTSLGIPAVCTSRENLEKLAQFVEENPDAEICVNLNDLKITAGDISVPCEIPESACKALTTGQWDFMAQLLEANDEIDATAKELPYMTNFA
jgi:3-isopropylmalate/(R)-2-methylmalate dehydratase small subunit